MYTKQKFGQELKKQIEKNFNIIKIARWAECIYSNYCREISTDLNDVLMTLSIMEHGPEFEYTEEELRLLAQKLIDGEDNPLNQINEMKRQAG